VSGSNEQADPESDLDPNAGPTGVTEEVGSEGGGPGDVEIGRNRQQGTGSETGETWKPTTRRPARIVRDETGRGRRSP